VVGIDPTGAMVTEPRRKLRRLVRLGRILLWRAVAEDLHFRSAVFEAAIVAFGVRAFADPVRGLGEALRIPRPR